MLRLVDPGIFDGATVGVQPIARRYEEEMAWAIKEIILAALNNAGVI